MDIDPILVRVVRMLEISFPHVEVEVMINRILAYRRQGCSSKVAIVAFWRLQLTSMGVSTLPLSELPLDGHDDEFIDMFILRIMPILRASKHYIWYHHYE